jgi:hypothetical protein
VYAAVFIWFVILAVAIYAAKHGVHGFAVGWSLRYSRPDVHRPYRVPFCMAGSWICSILPTFLCLLATVVLI